MRNDFETSALSSRGGVGPDSLRVRRPTIAQARLPALLSRRAPLSYTLLRLFRKLYSLFLLYHFKILPAANTAQFKIRGEKGFPQGAVRNWS